MTWFRKTQQEDLFTLPGVTAKIDQAALIPLISAEGGAVSDLLYDPPALTSAFKPWRHIVRKITFTRVSFMQTAIEDFEFIGCTFKRCLFIGTIFRNCRFTSCHFIDCNPFRIEFMACFVDPAQFDQCLPKKKYENVGLHLYHELLRNSRQEVQPDFADEAQYRFRKWQRYQVWAEMLNSNKCWNALSRVPTYVGLLLFDITSGSGMKVGRLLCSCLFVLLAATILNWQLASALGLQQDKHVIKGFGDAIYVTTVIMTTLGLGDITPTTLSGRLAVSCEAIVGFVLFAFLTSTLYRKLSS